MLLIKLKTKEVEMSNPDRAIRVHYGRDFFVYNLHRRICFSTQALTDVDFHTFKNHKNVFLKSITDASFNSTMPFYFEWRS